MRKELLAIFLLPVLHSTAWTQSSVVTVDGYITMGSSMGLIVGGQREYPYAGNTRNLAVLMKGCPITMGQQVPCVVRFETDGRSAINIISAAPPAPKGDAVNKPGNVFDASVCDHKVDVDYFVVKPGCQHFDSLAVQVLTIDGDVARLKWNGQIKYALAQRVTINCQGTSVSLASYLGKNFPPGMKSC